MLLSRIIKITSQTYQSHIVRLLLFCCLLAVTSCARIPQAPELPNVTGYLSKKATRQLVEHWVAKDYPDTVSGRPISLTSNHSNLPTITSLTPVREFSKGDPNPESLGALSMAHSQTPPAPLAITPKSWQLTSQPATIIARSQADGSLQLTAYDFREETTLNNHPLSARYSLPFDYIEEQENKIAARFLALFKPLVWAERRGFYLATAYDPDKIPLIFIHGLLSTPLDFEKMVSAIAAEPDLWDKYQFWYYFYPTGDPWVATAAHFRKDFQNLVQTLDPDQNDRPLRQDTTIIAHSMGGLISRLSLSEQSEILYQKYFNRSLDKIRLPSYQKKKIRDQLLFEPLSEPSRIIFLATPHKGSGLAGGPLLWLAETLVKAPATIIGTTLHTAQMLALAQPDILTQHGNALLTGNENSVNGLKPEHPALIALESMPIRQGVKLHNIIATITGGERGLGDWVVPLKSARLESAHTETIVRGNHQLIDDPEAHQAIFRILRE